MIAFEAHDHSKAGAGMGHQTESHAVRWDAELVPDAGGRTRRPEPDCPVELALAAVSGRWTTLVLRELMGGPLSFGELSARLPDISPKVLTERLRTLEGRGLAVRERLAGFPVRTRYGLTTAGAALRPLLVELYRTGVELAEAGAAEMGQGSGKVGGPVA
ncbi:winged helix-turn-helix transcriptional regulator [Streptomyces sp. NPDC091273]|uniref:winged helix-turn-helix transcriptional regulator n=1 Tax=unclassified Streptomyces TaxID=2593676 RepID=UPI002887636D|nr:helix-turn-helix domain-containing protein [Streptomyces sp. DSM 41633]